MKIAAAASAFPKHWYEQPVLTEYLAAVFGPRQAERLRSLHANCGVRGRYLALPLEDYAGLHDFTASNAAWLAAAVPLGASAVQTALDRAGLRADQVDTIIFSTVTGLSSPSVDARLFGRLGLRPDCQRVPLFGLGCVAGAAALSRAADLVRGDPRKVVVVLTVELCSLTLQRDDPSVANLISSGLFGDGAAAAVVVGAEVPCRGPTIAGTRSVFYPDTERVMGWDIGAHGFRIVLSAEVPSVARERLPLDVDAFLAAHGLGRAEVQRWIAHPGGPKVLQALQDGLELPREALAISWDCLADAGNLSSASVLMILERTLHERPLAAGAPGVLLAMGPGFCSELLLLRG